jgi:hypothetical protein
MLSLHAANWKAAVACFEDQCLYFLDGTIENYENPWSEQPMLQSRLEQGSVTYVFSRKYWSRSQVLQICNRNIDSTNKALFCLSHGYACAKAQL